MTDGRLVPLRMLGFFTWDLTVVISFVAVGRDTHEEALDLARVFTTATPFLIALGASWLPTRVRLDPAAARSGVWIGIVTAALGLVLRRFVFDEGLSGAFPVITTIYLLGLIVGGRVLWHRRGLVGKRSASGRSADGPGR